MKKITQFITFTFLLFIYGCFPGPVIYYEPISTDGELIQTHCGTAAAPKDTIQFQYENVKIQITSYVNYLRIYLYVPEGQSARLSSPDILIWSENGETKEKITIEKISYYNFNAKHYSQLGATDTMAGRVRKVVFGTEPQLFEIGIKTNEPTKEHFFIQLPSVIITNKNYELPIIEFIKKEGFGIFPVNC
jgi:hypothetical protein